MYSHAADSHPIGHIDEIEPDVSDVLIIKHGCNGGDYGGNESSNDGYVGHSSPGGIQKRVAVTFLARMVRGNAGTVA